MIKFVIVITIMIILMIIVLIIKTILIIINNNDNNNHDNNNVLISVRNAPHNSLHQMRNVLYNLPTQQHLYSDAPPQSLHPYTA